MVAWIKLLPGKKSLHVPSLCENPATVEAGGLSGEKIHPRQSEGEKFIEYTIRGLQTGQQSRVSAMRQWVGAVFKCGRWGVWVSKAFPLFFFELCLVVSSPLVSQGLWICWDELPGGGPVCIQPESHWGLFLHSIAHAHLLSKSGFYIFHYINKLKKTQHTITPTDAERVCNRIQYPFMNKTLR